MCCMCKRAYPIYSAVFIFLLTFFYALVVSNVFHVESA